MIIVLDNSGRLCNRLVLFAHVCATAIESKQSFCHLMAGDVMSFAKLDKTELAVFNIFCIEKIPLWSFIMRCRGAFYERISLPNVERYKQGNVMRTKKMTCHSFPLHIIFSWWYRNAKALIRQRNNICRILAPKDEYLYGPKDFAEKIRVCGCLLVGVHVRRGDYRGFAGGRYFFSDEEYVRFLKMTQEVLPGKVRFVMVSDEPLDEFFFKHKGLDVSIFRGEDFREDLVMLSLCDYVIGPWSSFSWWASYYGGNKLCHLHNRDDVVRFDSFHDIIGDEV